MSQQSTSVLPKGFDSHGMLPPGEYHLTLDNLRGSWLVDGPRDRPNWDRDWRLWLVMQLTILVNQLWKCEITDIFVGGSFVEDYDRPGDIDGYFVCTRERFMSGELVAQAESTGWMAPRIGHSPGVDVGRQSQVP